MAQRYSITFASPDPLACRLVVVVEPHDLIAPEALSDVAALTCARAGAAGARGLEIELTEPLELVAAARQLCERVPGAVRGFATSEPARALLADAEEPTLSAWRWLLAQLALPNPPDGAFAAAVDAVALRGWRGRPLIALRFPGAGAPGIYGGHGAGGLPLTRLFDQDDIVVGRANDADVQITNETVSRRHCKFTRRDGMWTVKDLGSSSGLGFEEHCVAELAVASGDEIRVGRATVEVVAIL